MGKRHREVNNVSRVTQPVVSLTLESNLTVDLLLIVIVIIIITVSTACERHCSRSFTRVTHLVFTRTLRRCCDYLHHFLEEETDTERLKNSPKNTQVRWWISTQAGHFWSPSS